MMQVLKLPITQAENTRKKRGICQIIQKKTQLAGGIFPLSSVKRKLGKLKYFGEKYQES